MRAATRFPVKPISGGRFTIGFEIPWGAIPDNLERYGLDLAMSREEAIDLRDRLIELLGLPPTKPDPKPELDALLRSTWAGFGPEMRRVFGSEGGFRRAILTGKLA